MIVMPPDDALAMCFCFSPPSTIHNTCIFEEMKVLRSKESCMLVSPDYIHLIHKVLTENVPQTLHFHRHP